MKKYEISQEVLQSVKHTLKFAGFENGGIIGKDCTGKIVAFMLDKPTKKYSYKYVPNISFLNQVIEHWNKNNLDFCGLIHSHPENCPKLSYVDVQYANLVLTQNCNLHELLFGITQCKDETVDIIMYLFFRDTPGGDITFKRVKLDIASV